MVEGYTVPLNEKRRFSSERCWWWEAEEDAKPSRKAGRIGQSDATKPVGWGFLSNLLFGDHFTHLLNGLGIKVIYRMSRSRKEATTVDPAERLAELVDLRALTSQLTRHEAEIAKSLGTALVRMAC